MSYKFEGIEYKNNKFYHTYSIENGNNNNPKSTITTYTDEIDKKEFDRLYNTYINIQTIKPIEKYQPIKGKDIFNGTLSLNK